MSRASGWIVEAPSRLHMGLIDLCGDLGRRFGGIGAALESPSLLLEARKADALSAEGPERERVLSYARRFLEHRGLRVGALLRVRRAVPGHSGLGSGTQIALATARGLAALYGEPSDVAGLARATGRARRSAIGTWAFQQGGFILEGGRRTEGEEPGPLLLRRALPTAWRCVVAIPPVPRGLSGEVEEQAFRSLPPAPPDVSGRIARLILSVVLPALAEEDLMAFGHGVSEVQALVGEMFRSVQGGRYAHPRVAGLVEALRAEGAAGAGQSSWGPAVYGLFPDDAAARRAADRVAALVGDGLVLVTAFANHGALCRPGDVD
jgi:beta-ribofuranosylaminobenzene 5'-phosphate synthase